MSRWITWVVVGLAGALGGTAAEPNGAPRVDGAPARPLLLVHYMPWFVAPGEQDLARNQQARGKKPTDRVWGWHWTMNAYDPDAIVGDRRPIASHFYPQIGPYDSGDPAVIEYHLLLMKIAGIDGIVVDWYGRADLHDYALLHRNTDLLLQNADRLGLRYAICYEDQTVPALVKAGRLAEADRVRHAAAEIAWLAEHWFPRPGYVRYLGQPLLLSFGQNGLTDAEWSATLTAVKTPIAYISQHHRRSAASGVFDWPIPQRGVAAQSEFRDRTGGVPVVIPCVFPRFVDIYAQAKVHESWGTIADDEGKTFRKLLDDGLAQRTRFVQIATWNDWGEGTQIEPSREFGTRDLEVIQAARRHLGGDTSVVGTAADLTLPLQLLHRRRQARPAPSLDTIAQHLAQGDFALARAALSAAP